MKKNYESLIVLNTTGREGDIDQLVQEVGREIEGEGAVLDEIKQLGLTMRASSLAVIT